MARKNRKIYKRERGRQIDTGVNLTTGLEAQVRFGTVPASQQDQNPANTTAAAKRMFSGGSHAGDGEGRKQRPGS